MGIVGRLDHYDEVTLTRGFYVRLGRRRQVVVGMSFFKVESQRWKRRNCEQR